MLYRIHNIAIEDNFDSNVPWLVLKHNHFLNILVKYSFCFLKIASSESDHFKLYRYFNNWFLKLPICICKNFIQKIQNNKHNIKKGITTITKMWVIFKEIIYEL